MISAYDICCQQAALATKLAADTITEEFVETQISFLFGMKTKAIKGTNQVLSDVYSSGLEWRKGIPCGLRDPQGNTYRRRQMNLQPYSLEKIICKSVVEDSPYSIAQFAHNLVQEVQNAFVHEMTTAFMDQVLQDDLVFEEKSKGTGLKMVKATDDALTIAAAKGSVDKVDSWTTDTIVEWFSKLIASFVSKNPEVDRITIVAPYSFGVKVSALLANKQCCEWYNGQTFIGQNGISINHFMKPIHIVLLDDKYFKSEVAGYTRIFAFANTAFEFGYRATHLYNTYSPKYFPVSMTVNPSIAKSVIDLRIIPVPEYGVGIALSIDADMSIAFARMRSRSIMLLDIKDSFFNYS